MSDAWRAGFAQRAIPVADGLQLIGYENCGPRLSQGQHDPLYARAVIFESGGRRCAIVTLDLLAVDETMTARLADSAKEFGVEEDCLFLCAAHNHSGPGGYFTADARFAPLLSLIFGEPDAAVVDAVERSAQDALADAAASMRPCTLSAAAVRADGIGTDRNDPTRPGDPFLTLFRFACDNGRRLLVYSAACHPTVLHEENRMLSADWPGETARALKEMGAADAVLFLNGSAGDVSTRFTRAGADGFAETRRLGGRMAEQIRSAAEHLSAVNANGIEPFAFEMPLRVRRVDPQEAAAELARAQTALEAGKAAGAAGGALRLLQATAEGAYLGALYARFQPTDDVLSVRVRGLRFGGYALTFFPFELFSTLSTPLRERTAGRFVPVGYACGYLGYLPDAAIEHTDNYEKYTTAFAYGQGERLLERAAREIKIAGA
ncbi:MAG: neutral/alkaline non-lysosomal ceramidase N-terminal domain-containing protein [Oscillospiraceae bacterium]|nr:neutral/alkaline non-lysosomal ceramidase N-terminal domain-containing protein [Oscillospiraceae bacterium]